MHFINILILQEYKKVEILKHMDKITKEMNKVKYEKYMK